MSSVRLSLRPLYDNTTEIYPQSILLMNGPDEGIGISMLLQVIEYIQMHAVEECPSETKYSEEEKAGLLKK